MTDITTIIVVAVVVIVVAVLAVAAATMLRRRRSAELRDQFGPEYERTVRDADDPRDAEKELAQRRKRHDALTLRSLDPQERDGYRRRWQQVQGGFVDDPSRAVHDADALVALSERLFDCGIQPYYLHQLDRVAGAAHFEVPQDEGRALVDALRWG